jgi:hypothetical protein
MSKIIQCCFTFLLIPKGIVTSIFIEFMHSHDHFIAYNYWSKIK